MVTYIHGPLLVVDNNGDPVPNAAGKVYAPSDSTYATPLPMTDMAGVTLVNATTNAKGYVSFIKVEDYPEVVWVSGTSIQPLRSFGSVLDQATAAKVAAEAAATASGLSQQAAEQARQDVEDLIAAGGGGGGVTVHGQLQQLTNDDHPQYLNNARGDARYYLKAQSDAQIAAATAANSAADRARGNHTGEQAQSTVTGLVASLTNRLQSVNVSTGSEARPTGSTMVLWVGGTTQPVNMASGDVWLAATGVDPGDDLSAPSIPTGVAVSGIFPTGATVTWNPSSDNVAVTGYDVQLNGSSVGTPATNEFLLTGLTAETAYTVRVRARDAVPNWSALSTTVGFSTPPVGASVEHNVFGATAHPGPLTVFDEDPITLATAFYTVGAGANGWSCIGGRLYIPAAASIPASCTFSLWTGTNPDLASTPDRTGTMTGITAGQWNEIEWSAALPMTPGAPVWIGYHFAAGQYVSVASTTTGSIQSGSTTLLYEAEQGEFSGRSRFKLDASGTTTASGAHYGIDIIVQEA